MRSCCQKALWALAWAIALSGCAALAPQFYAPDIAPSVGGTAADRDGMAGQSNGTAPPIRKLAQSLAAEEYQLDDAVRLAHSQQRQYAAVVQSLSNSGSGLSMAALGAAVGGGIMSLTDGNAKYLGPLAAITAGLFVAGTTFVPKERASAFGAGVVALECAIGSAVALNEPTLQATVNRVRESAEQLDMDIVHMERWMRPVKQESFRGGPATSCPKTPVPAMCGYASLDADARKKCEQLDAAHAQMCAPATRTETALAPDPEVDTYLKYARKLRTSMADGVVAGDRYVVQAELAGSELRGKARAIGEAVRIEAAKMQPDVAAVKAAALSSGDLGAVFGALPKSVKSPPAAAPAAGSPGQALSTSAPNPRARSDSQAVNTLKGADVDRFDTIKVQTGKAAASWSALQGALIRMEARQARSRSLDACTVPGVARSVTVVAMNPASAADAGIPVDDGVRQLLAPGLGVDLKAPNLNRLVDEALSNCQEHGILPDAPSPGTLSVAAMSKLVNGVCRK